MNRHSGSRWRRWWLAISLLFALLAAGGYLALDRWQRGLIFSVELGEQRWWREAPAGTDVFDLTLANGDTVRAWFLAQDDPAAPTVLYLHGSRWNLNGSVFRMERWHRLGFSVLAIDYRGFGASTPRLPSQRSATEDALAGLDELARRQPDPQRRYVYGHSLGGAIAAQLAALSKRPEFSGLILESTFTHVRDMLPLTRWGHLPGLAGLVTQPFDTQAALRQYDGPLLLLHGSGDRVVPVAMSDALYAGLPPGAALRQHVVIEGASHSGAGRYREYDEAVLGFVELLLSDR
ncbi:MAG: alpha/beta hydrolase [Pigmentiphaga sp.]